MLVLLLALAPAHAADPAAGQALYAANCTACHGKAGDGKGPAAIALKPKPADFTSAVFWTPERTDAALAASIVSGKPGTGMSGFTQFSAGEVGDLVAYLRTFAPAAP